ncbi:hypothetical protein KFL_005570010, partial [Klebsormidium nitens]
EQRYAAAQYELGMRYNQGEGVDEVYSKAVEWYRKAAEQGYVVAQYELGMHYYKGEGIGRDFYKAVEWLRTAAEQGYAVAQYELGMRFYKGEGVGKDFSKAMEWYQKASEQECHNATVAMELLAKVVVANRVQIKMGLFRGISVVGLFVLISLIKMESEQEK